jgi:hypothetical protein
MDIKLYKSPWIAIKIISISSIFVFGGLFMLTNTDTPKWVWYLGISFFGIGYPVGLFHLFDRRPQIIINELGIFDRTYNDFINWDVIRLAYPLYISGQKFICLVVDENYKLATNKGIFSNWTLNFNRKSKEKKLNLVLGLISIDEIKLTEFISSMIDSKPDDRKQKLDSRPSFKFGTRRTAGNKMFAQWWRDIKV